MIENTLPVVVREGLPECGPAAHGNLCAIFGHIFVLGIIIKKSRQVSLQFVLHLCVVWVADFVSSLGGGSGFKAIEAVCLVRNFVARFCDQNRVQFSVRFLCPLCVSNLGDVVPCQPCWAGQWLSD